MSQPPSTAYQQEALPGCWWHPERKTALRCTRCDRPACPDCLREASVGYQCIDCVHAGQRQVRAQRSSHRRAGLGSGTVAGARLSANAVVTPVLIALNVVVYVITAAQAGSAMDNQESRLFVAGALLPSNVAGNGEWWRLLTTGFLHYGLLHIAMNMIALWVLGRDLELLLGKVRFIALYAVSMLGGSAAVFLFGEVNRPTVGASGAIYGLMGAVAVAVVRLRLNPLPALGVIVLNIVLSVSIPGISLLAHIGGLVVGALAAIAMVYAPERNRALYQGGTVVVLAVALVVLIVTRDNQLADLACQPYADNRELMFCGTPR